MMTAVPPSGFTMLWKPHFTPGFCPKGDLKPARGATTLVTVAHIADVAALTGVSLKPGVEFTLPRRRQSRHRYRDSNESQRGHPRDRRKNSFLQVPGDCRSDSVLRPLPAARQPLPVPSTDGRRRRSSAPGSSTPAAMCDMHHIQSWSTGGKTDLPNLTFVNPGAFDNPGRWLRRKAEERETRRKLEGLGGDEPP